MRKEEHDEGHGGGERWLISYADFITLLMVFFIIMYSMSKIDTEKYMIVAKSFSETFNPSGGGGGSGSGVPPASGDSHGSTENTDPLQLSAEEREKMDMERIVGQLATYFIAADMNDSILMHIDSRGLVISLNATVLYESGSADIRPDMSDVLIGVGNIIKTLDHYIRVEGHTDNVPIGSNNTRYKSNWDLSTARATNVIDLFIKEAGIPPQKLIASGYSEYRPIASNDTAEGRSKNRRVDIIILSLKYSEIEDMADENLSQGETPAQIDGKAHAG